MIYRILKTTTEKWNVKTSKMDKYYSFVVQNRVLNPILSFFLIIGIIALILFLEKILIDLVLIFITLNLFILIIAFIMFASWVDDEEGEFNNLNEAKIYKKYLENN